jgi:hypothetical protein
MTTGGAWSILAAVTFTLLPVWLMLSASIGSAAAPSARVNVHVHVQAQAQASEADRKQTQQDEYTRVELMPEIGSLTMIEEVAVTTPGATEWTTPLRRGFASNVVSVTDMMTGQALKFTQTTDELRVTLARRIAGEGGQARLRVTTTGKESTAYWRVSDGPRGFSADALAAHGARVQPAHADEVVFAAALPGVRNAIVLPAGYRVLACTMPSQVLSLADGRTQLSFMWQYRSEITSLQVRIKPDAPTGDAAKPRPLTNARSWEPPPTQGPTERARLSERAAQDRDIVYFLQPPETHAFSLYHDYTESREGMDKYLNVVRSGSTVSSPSGMVLDTGEAMKVEVLKGAQLKAAGIDAGGDQVAADQEVVVFRYPAVKPGSRCACAFRRPTPRPPAIGWMARISSSSAASAVRATLSCCPKAGI